MFHSVRARDANVARWEAWRDYLVATPGLYAVAQNDPVDVGIPADKWAVRVSVLWDYALGDNDADAATLLAARVNALTATGKKVIVDEVHMGGAGYDPKPMLALAVGLFDTPASVYYYLVAGKNISYEELDESLEYPVISLALAAGVGLLPEIYISQPLAEKSGNISAYIQRWYRGPGDAKMPYLLALHAELDSVSPIHFIYPVIDRFFKGESRQKLKRSRFLDLVMQRGFLSYPEVFRQGFGTYIWDSSRLKDLNRAADVAKLHAFYYGEGYEFAGKQRYYSPNRT